MGRRHNEETSFGSDSFLDVIANIVGILIILIVVAGVRVSRAPLVSIQSEVAAINEDIQVDLLPITDIENDEPILAELFINSPEPIVAEEQDAVLVPDFSPPKLEVFPKVQPVEAKRELTTEIKNYQKLLTQLKNEIAKLEDQRSQLKPDQIKESQELNNKLDELTKSQSELSALLKLIEISSEENRRSQKVVEQLIEQKSEIKSPEPETETLAHKLNPVGKVVSGNEVHFRLSENKISFVPVQQLSELVKRDMQKRRDFLLKQQRFQSRVGPVNGYEMEYLVQREGGGIFDEARYGTGRIRISVTDWILHPSEEIYSESLDDAIKPGSTFRTALISEGTNSTITFWVYPDSYELHRQLKQMVHDSGFWVASRPLPMGYPIAGSSSSGSKSIAQ